MSLLIQRTSSSDDNVEKQNQQCIDWIDQSSMCTLRNCQLVTTVNETIAGWKSIMIFRRGEDVGVESFCLLTCFVFVGTIKLLTFISFDYFNCSHALVCAFLCQ